MIIVLVITFSFLFWFSNWESNLKSLIHLFNSGRYVIKHHVTYGNIYININKYNKYYINIKYVIKSSLSLPKNYYNKFINYCYKNITDYSKLAINSMIGNFKPNLNKRGTQKHSHQIVVMHSTHI